MEFSIALEFGGAVVLIGGALVLGAISQFLGKTNTGFEWLPVAIAAGIGGLFASEFIVAARTFGPVWEGLALVPALVGGIVLAVIADVATVRLTGGTLLRRPMSA
jgi:hypothetical protein